MMRVEYHPEAKEELITAFSWYFDQNPRVGVRFRAQVDATVTAAARMPRVAPLWPGLEEHEVRQALMRPFQYGVAYILRSELLFVVAVAHLKRMPGYWLHRLTFH